jgi:septal ring factor EnvC (AmiA/AmiB activator)
MKRWFNIIIFIVIILGVLGIIGYLQSEGVIKGFSWKGLSMIAAALAAPIKLIVNAFSSPDEKFVKEIEEKQKRIQKDEVIHRQETDRRMEEKQQRIQMLNKELDSLETRIALLKEKQKAIEPEVMNMSDKQKQSEAQKYWGK